MSILNAAQQRKLRWIGHILNNKSLLGLFNIIEGRMLGKATRKRLQMLSDVTSKTYKDLMKEAGDPSGWMKRLS